MLAEAATVIGLILTLVGAGLGAYAVFMTKEQATHLGVSRWAGETDEENSRLPVVQNLLRQSCLASIGFDMIAAGTLLQIVGVAIAH